VLFIPQHVIDKIDKLFFDFLWDKGKVMVKRTTIIAPIDAGGMNMINFPSMVASSKIMWIKRLLDNCNPKWKNLALYLCGLSETDLTSKLSIDYIDPKCGDFYTQILKYWFTFYSVEPVKKEEILNEKLFKNSFIKINNTYVHKEYKDWQIAGLTHVKYIYNNNIILTKEQLEERYHIHIPDMKYNSLISALPKNWKKLLSLCDNLNDPIVDRSETYIYPIQKDIKLVSNKDIYSCLIKTVALRPTAESKWIEYYPFLETMEWKIIYCIPAFAFKETF